MEQTQSKTNARLKLELQLNQSVQLTLMKDKCYVGENSFGQYYLYQVKDESGVEYSFFAPSDVHATILESGIKAGDSFTLSKLAMQNGKKMSSKLVFEVAAKAETPVKKDVIPFDIPDDGFKQLMQTCVQEAVQIVKEVNTIPWQNDDIRSIALTMFIQRAKLS